MRPSLATAISLSFLTASISIGSPADSTIVAWWHFNEGSGNIIYDSSDFHNDGNIHNGSWEPGGLHFNGYSTYVDLPNQPELKPTEEFTLEAWVSLDTLYFPQPPGNVNQGVILSNLGYYPAGGGYQLIVDNPGFRFEARVGISPNAIFSNYTPIPQAKTFYHLAATYQRVMFGPSRKTVVKTYLNGVITDSSVFQDSIHYDATPSFIIGTNIEGLPLGGGYPREFPGIIGGIRISNVARTPSQFFFPSPIPPVFTDISADISGLRHGGAAWGDYDNDGDLDLVLNGTDAADAARNNILYRNDDGSFVEAAAGLTADVINNNGTSWGDYDNDGDLDLLIVGAYGPQNSNPSSQIFRNDGGTFTSISVPFLGLQSDAEWGDFDGDGDLDVVIAGSTDNGSNFATKIYRNNGGVFSEVPTGIQGAWGASVDWGDYDNDGDLDLLILGYGGFDFTRVYRNDGPSGGGWNFANIGASLVAVAAGSATWGDYDNDGDLDILLTGSGNSIIYRNDGGGTFSNIGPPITGVSISSSAWGDYDADGDLDIALCGTTSPYGVNFTTRVYRNNGGNFALVQSDFPGVWYPSVAWGDYDNDGDGDLFVSGLHTDSLGNEIAVSRIYRNNIRSSTFAANNRPDPPASLWANATPDSIVLHWGQSNDVETPQPGLSYNLRVGTTPGNSDIVTPMANPASGFRKVARIGNAQHRTSWKVVGLPPGTYYWSVQAIDNGFAASDFSPEDTLTVPIPPPNNTIVISVSDGGGNSAQLTFGFAAGATDSLDTIYEEELPPKPPVGNFDARWNIDGSDGSLTNMQDSLHGGNPENIYEGQVQPGPAGYPVTLQWNSYALLPGTLILRDAATHGSLYRINLLTQNAFIISQSTPQPFEIVYNGDATLVENVLGQWNMLSIPVVMEDPRVNKIFPTATSPAYWFDHGYASTDTMKNGVGYWLRFPSSQLVSVSGVERDVDTIDVVKGWNMIGGLSSSITVSTIQQIPSNNIVSNYFYYTGGYSAASSLIPMKAYWVKAAGAGQLILTASLNSQSEAALIPSVYTTNLSELEIRDANGNGQTLYFGNDEPAERRFADVAPPLPPAGLFDARFSSDQFVAALGTERVKTQPLLVSGASYPVTIRWKQVDESLQGVLVVNGKTISLDDEGKTTIHAPGVIELRMTRGGRADIPSEYVLYQNFPNPFNPSTTITYGLPSESHVKLTVYTVLGEEIETLVSQIEQSGTHSVEWNARGASGTYFYKLESTDVTTPSRTVVKMGKMTLLR